MLDYILTDLILYLFSVGYFCSGVHRSEPSQPIWKRALAWHWVVLHCLQGLPDNAKPWADNNALSKMWEWKCYCSSQVRFSIQTCFQSTMYILITCLWISYRVEMSVYDNEEQCTFIILGDAGKELTGRKATELIDAYVEVSVILLKMIIMIRLDMYFIEFWKLPIW